MKSELNLYEVAKARRQGRSEEMAGKSITLEVISSNLDKCRQDLQAKTVLIMFLYPLQYKSRRSVGGDKNVHYGT